MQTQLQNFHELVKSFEAASSAQLPSLTGKIKEFIQGVKNDQEKLPPLMIKLSDSIMRCKDIKPEKLLYYEDLISEIFKIAADNQFRFGTESLSNILSSSHQFYKTAGEDPLLELPLGRDRPLQQYSPEPNQTCDVVRPYITSTSICGWTRCFVQEVNRNFYIYKFENSKREPIAKREKPWFAKKGTRLTDYDWRMNLKKGDLIDAYLDRVWYPSTVAEVLNEGIQGEDRVIKITFRRMDPNGDRTDPNGEKFFGLNPTQDECLQVLSPRIQVPGKMLTKKLCYYTYKSEEYLVDDIYDILFEDQYKQEPFYAITRTINTKSTSYLKFINTYVKLGGLTWTLHYLQTNASDTIIFPLVASLGFIVRNFPYMFVRQSEQLRKIYKSLAPYLLNTAKTINLKGIELIHFCMDNVGRRILSLSELHSDMNELRKGLIKQFLKMNLERQLLAIRYIQQLVFPKKPNSEHDLKQLANFMKDQQMFAVVFNSDMHEQFLSRTGFLLEFMVQQNIVSEEQLQNMWKQFYSSNDLRKRAVLEKFLTENMKKLPVSFLEYVTKRLITLRQTQLTIDNLNLLKQFKNTEISNEVKINVIEYLQDIITVKSVNIKQNIEEEVEKVFKSYVETIEDPKIKMKVLDSMVQKLQDCKKIRNEIELLKGFLRTYKEKKQKQNQMVEEQGHEDIPQTRLEALHFIKAKGIYAVLLSQLFKEKEAGSKKDILEFISYLFECDPDDASPTVKHIYERLGPASIFFEWINKISSRCCDFITQLLEGTKDFNPFQDINQAAFDAIQSLVININEQKRNLKILTTYQEKKEKQNTNSVQMGPVTGDAYEYCANDKKDEKPFGPQQLEAKKHIYLLISPFKLIGMKFLEKLLYVVKQNPVYNSIIKFIIQLVTNLDETIEDKTQQYRKQFLFDILKEIKYTIDEDKYDDKIKTKLEVSVNLFLQFFAETEKDGLGECSPYFEVAEGEKITLNINNLFDQDAKKKKKKPLPKFDLSCNQNNTIWTLKKLVAEMVCEAPEEIDIIKYSDPMPDTNNGKSLSELHFFDKENIRVARKPIKPIPKSNLLNEDKSDISEKFQAILSTFFMNYQSTEVNGLDPEGFQRLSKQKWRGILFKQKERLHKLFQTYDLGQKGYLTFAEFKKFFYQKLKTNQTGVWNLINLSGFKNNLKPAKGQKQHLLVNTSNLPRKILSCPEAQKVIFELLEKQTFKQIHINFYRLLCMLEVNKQKSDQIEDKIYTIIEKESGYALCYSLETMNGRLAKRQYFYFDFWKNGGVTKIQNRIKQMLSNGKSLYDLDSLTKNQIIPAFIRIINMYICEILSKYKIVRLMNENRVPYVELEDLVKKINENDPKVDDSKLTNTGKILIGFGNVDEILKQIFTTCNFIFENIIRNFSNEKADYLQKLLNEIMRVLGSLVCSHPNSSSINAVEYVVGLKNGSMSNRRSAVILIYIYLFHSEKETSQDIQQVLNKLLEQTPTDSKLENSNYFSLLKEIISKYLKINEQSNSKDEFFINLGNHLLNNLFDKLQGESRTNEMPDKTIQGILSVINQILGKKEVCLGLNWRMRQITQKCLFAYDIEQKLKAMEITEEMLTNSKQETHFKNYVMCKTEDNRNLAYNIVAKLHHVSPSIEPIYIENYIMPIIKGISSEVRLTDAKTTNVGLMNFGSTCYMNSMLQVLNAVGPFRNSIMKCESENPLIKQLKKLFAALFYSERNDYAPEGLLNVFQHPINPSLQQDTTQFLNQLFNQTEAGLAKTKYKRLLDEIFKGKTTAQIICQSCNYIKQNNEQFSSFSVEIEGKLDLQSALQGSYQGEVISDYFCENCQTRGLMTKRNILSQIPSVMFIHLRRIVFDYDTFLNKKIHTQLHFPEQLNIQPYTKQGVNLRENYGVEYMKNLAHNEEETKNFSEIAQHGKPKDFYKMKLKGVIIHTGSGQSGHYYSVLEDNKSWRKLDDARVSYFTKTDFEKDCYGGIFAQEQWGSSSSTNAYVLVYEKVVKNPIELANDGSEMTDEPVKLQYDDIKIYNSPEDYRELWLDNHKFMLERHLLDPRRSRGFIEFMCKIINDCPPQIDKIELVAEIVYKVSFHSGYVGDLIKIVKQNSATANPNLFYTHIINNKPKTFKLLFSTQRSVREFMATFIYTALLSILKSYDRDHDDAIKYIVQLLDSMTNDASKNWSRIDGYFSLLFQLVSISPDFPLLWRLFRTRNMISNLIDFVMEKMSPVSINPKKYSLGTKMTPMDFRSGISIILFFVKHSYLLTGKSYEAPLIAENLLFHLNDDDVICLCHKEFYKKMITEKQNLKDLGLLIQKLCINNLQFSTAICEVVLEAICSITDFKDEMQQLSAICLQILKIRDDYWLHRANMLLGVGGPQVTGKLMECLDEEKFSFQHTLLDSFTLLPLMSYVYNFYDKNPLACLQLCKAIIVGCSVSDISMKYLTRQPSCSYLYPNYLCWMENYIKSFVHYDTTDSKLKERIAGDVDYLMRYLENLKKYMNEEPQVDFYKSVITGETKQRIFINKFEKEGIQLNLYDHEVYCCNSEPLETGGNLAMRDILDGMKLKKVVSKSSNILHFFHKYKKPLALSSGPVPNNEEEKELMSLTNPEGDKPGNIDQGNQVGQKAEEQANKEVKIEPQQNIQASQMEQEANVEGVYTTNYFREIEIINNTKEKKVLTIKFSSNQYPNMILPEQKSWIIPANHKHKERMWVAKQDPTQDWGELRMVSFVENYSREKHDKNQMHNWFKTYGEKDNSMEGESNGNSSQNEIIKAINKASMLKELQHPEEMNCPMCTLFNPVTNQFCSICGASLH